MKRVLLLVILAGIMASGGLYAATVNVGWAVGHSGSGGEFVLTTSDRGTFNSFCIEDNEFVNIGGNYYYTTSGGAILGGVSGGSPDPISIGTAYLFRNFHDGTLVDNLLVPYTSLPSEQDNLQNAIWFLEGEIFSDQSANPYILRAEAALGMTLAQIEGDANGLYGVGAMNLWLNPDNTGNAQDMLFVPDGGTTVMLLGMGLSGIAMFSRRVRR